MFDKFSDLKKFESVIVEAIDSMALKQYLALIYISLRRLLH
jgi:hypothetical protein